MEKRILLRGENTENTYDAPSERPYASIRVTKPQRDTSLYFPKRKSSSPPLSPIVDEEERKLYDHTIGRCERKD